MSAIKTRSQTDMKLAFDRVREVVGKPWMKEYGTLCHGFPVMVLTSGLCQAVAFSFAKAQDKEAHRRVLEDIRAIIGRDPAEVATVSAEEYIRMTRRVLDAWIYYKRFAVSLLDVGPGEEHAND
jgi:CRISPR-associated protein Cmr5